MTLDLTNHFIKGLKEYNLTIKEIEKGQWKYCGGDKGRHLNYWKLCFPNYPTPDKVNECVCGHRIEGNCYITDDFNDGEILILGNCCIKKFCPKSSRTCEICEQPHKNRKVHECRKGICDNCNKNVILFIHYVGIVNNKNNKNDEKNH